MKKVTREEFGKACLEYDLKSGTLIDIDGRIGFQDRTGTVPNGTYKALGTIDEDLSEMTAEEWVKYYSTDFYNLHRPMLVDEPYAEDIASVYEQMLYGLRDDVDITGLMAYGLNSKADASTIVA